MVLLGTVEEFEAKAKDMILADPKKARLTTKYKKAEPVFVLKITDGKQTYKCEVTTEANLHKAQKLIASLMHLMTSPELMK